MNVKGVSSLQAYLLLGAILAASVGALFQLYREKLALVKIATEAQELANRLSSSAFTSSLGVVVPFELPETIGGEKYSLKIDNCSFRIVITSGKLTGREFVSFTSVDVFAENLFTRRIYFLPYRKGVLLSSFPQEPEGISIKTNPTPPEFYHFAKRNPEIAAFSLWSHYFLREKPVGYSENLLITENRSLKPVVLTEGNRLPAWVIIGGEEAGTPPTFRRIPSLTEAEEAGWLHSPEFVLGEVQRILKAETSENPSILPCVLMTRDSKFVAWRISWNGNVVYYQSMPWWWEENTPGFVWWSENFTLGVY